MKKTVTALLLAAILLMLPGCGGSAQPEAPAAPESTAPESASPLPSPTPEPDPESRVTIEIRNKSEQRSVGDFVVASSSFDYPVITITGEASAASDALESWADTVYQDRLSWAQDLLNEAETVYTEMPQFFMEPYFYTLTMTMPYVDETLATVLSSSESYMGGNHPMHSQSAVNLNLSTGSVLTLHDLCDEDALIAAAAENILQQIKAQDLASSLYENYSDFVPEGIVDGSWYLTSEGFNVIYTEYYLGPYSSGSFTFTVPFDVLDGILSPEYILD